MEKLTIIIPIFTEEIPTEKKHGVLYISEKYEVAVHLCACGCGQQSVTPLRNGEWNITKNGDKVSILPSIGNFTGERPNYHAHYFIRENQIDWC
jgi:hypothetical protein